MHEIFLMQQQNIWLELEMNRFMMLARLVRFNRDLVSGWWLLLKMASREIWSVVGWLLLNKKETWSVVGWLLLKRRAGKSGSGLWLALGDEDYLQLELEPATPGPINQLPSPEACARPKGTIETLNIRIIQTCPT